MLTSCHNNILNFNSCLYFHSAWMGGVSSVKSFSDDVNNFCKVEVGKTLSFTFLFIVLS
jgi:hypothetical protein